MFVIGDRVRLLFEMVDGDGRPIPIDTIGTLVGLPRGVPQINFGCYGRKMVPPHAIELIDLPDGAWLPEDGERLGLDVLQPIIDSLTWDVYALQVRARVLASRPFLFGRS